MSDLPIPVPVTSNNWHPIVTFDFGAEYAAEPFLVWLPDGSWSDAWVHEDGAYIDGTWRHVCGEDGSPLPEVSDQEPVAFKLVEGPNLDDIARIIAHHKLAA